MEQVAAAGHDVLVVTSGAPGAEANGFEVLAVRPRWGVVGSWAKLMSRHPLRSPRPLRADLEFARSCIARFGPQVAIVSEVMAESLARPLLPDIPWIYDAHNVEHVLFDRLAAEARNPLDRVAFTVDRHRVARAERALVAGADAVIAASEEDARGLHELGAQRQPIVVRSSVTTPANPAKPSAAGPIALFVGTLDYLPNTAAVRELAEDILPAARRSVPAARLSIVGRRPTSDLRSMLIGLDWVDLYEDAEDLGPHYESARCVVFPIRFGGGSRLKVSEALAWGLPSIGTSVAFAGLPIPDGAVCKAEMSEDLAAHVVDVMRDDSKADLLGRAAREHFENNLALPVVTRPLLDLIDELA